MCSCPKTQEAVLVAQSGPHWQVEKRNVRIPNIQSLTFLNVIMKVRVYHLGSLLKHFSDICLVLYVNLHLWQGNNTEKSTSLQSTCIK